MSQRLIFITLLFGCAGVTEKDSGSHQTEQPEDIDTGSEPDSDTNTEVDTGEDTAEDTADNPEEDTGNEENPPLSAESIAENLGLDGLNLHLDASEVAAQQAYGAHVFIDAFEDALLSILNDGTDEESPLALAETQASLISFLNDGSAGIWLIPDRERQSDDPWFPPEYGESLSDNWLFQLLTPSLSDHLFWVIVPRNGDEAHNYGFN